MLKSFVLTGALLADLTFNAAAGVQTTKFDPPLAINAFADIAAPNLLFNVLPLDFNLDGNADFNLAYCANSFGLAGIEIFFNTPSRIVVKGPLDVAVLPLGTIIGSKLKLPNTYQWSVGITNRDDVTQPLGDHQLVVVAVPNTIPMGVAAGFGSVLPTQFPPPQYPLVEGDVVGKAGVMAVEFYINGQPHYGYIQFDFRSKEAGRFGGTGGVIYGWAYETEPGVPIFAVPLDDKFDRDPRGNQRR